MQAGSMCFASRRFVTVLVMVLGLNLAIAGARADDSANPVNVGSSGSNGTGGSSLASLFTLDGFGTAGLAHSSQRRADYTFDNLQPYGVGRTRDWDPDVDSRLGLQLTGRFNEHISAVAQVISEYSWDGTYRPYLSWANLKYAFTPDFNVRAGRMAPGSFLESDSRRVGYANVEARPPIEVYRLLALKEVDGVDMLYRSHFGDVTNSASLIAGSHTVTNTRGVDVHSTHVGGVFDTVEFGATTLHFAYQLRDVDNQHPPLGRFMSLGASYNPGAWFITSEAAKAINYGATGIKATRLGWYVNGGMRLGAFTPYVTSSELLPTTNTFTTPIMQRTIAGGVRWDVWRNIDVKAQVDDIRLGDKSYGTLQNVLAQTPTGGRLTVTSVTVDFVF